MKTSWMASGASFARASAPLMAVGAEVGRRAATTASRGTRRWACGRRRRRRWAARCLGPCEGMEWHNPRSASTMGYLTGMKRTPAPSRVRDEWLRRVEAEYRSAALDAAPHALADPDRRIARPRRAPALRIVRDELAHATMSHRSRSLAGGRRRWARTSPRETLELTRTPGAAARGRRGPRLPRGLLPRRDRRRAPLQGAACSVRRPGRPPGARPRPARRGAPSRLRLGPPRLAPRAPYGERLRRLVARELPESFARIAVDRTRPRARAGRRRCRARRPAGGSCRSARYGELLRIHRKSRLHRAVSAAGHRRARGLVRRRSGWLGPT